MSKDIYFLSGLPRTGSTLLTSILSQNPRIHTGPNSALCQLMWDMQVSCWNTEQLRNRPETGKELLTALPDVFYKNAMGHIVDKCRSWTMPANVELIEKYITPTPKYIVMLRPISEIVKSFVYIRTLNGWDDPEIGLLDEGAEPIMRSLEGVKNARKLDQDQVLYIWYKEFVEHPDAVLRRLYDFCGWEDFEHNLNNIINPHFEQIDEDGLEGLHEIRPTITERVVNVELSNNLYKKTLQLDLQLRKIFKGEYNGALRVS